MRATARVARLERIVGSRTAERNLSEVMEAARESVQRKLVALWDRMTPEQREYSADMRQCPPTTEEADAMRTFRLALEERASGWGRLQ
jgi:hypothetical protein